MFPANSRSSRGCSFLMCIVGMLSAFGLVSAIRAQTPVVDSSLATRDALREKIHDLDKEVERARAVEDRLDDSKKMLTATGSEKRVREAEALAAECREFQKAANETAAGWKPINAQVQLAEQAAGETRQAAGSIRPSLDRVDQLAAQLFNRDQASEIVQRYEAAQATVKRGGERLAEARRLNGQSKDAFLNEKQSAETYATAQRRIDETLRRLTGLQDFHEHFIDRYRTIGSEEFDWLGAQRRADNLIAQLRQMQASIRGKNAEAEQDVANMLADVQATRNVNLASYTATLSKLQSDLDAINKATSSIETDAAALRDQRSKQSKFADEAVAAAENAQSDAEIRLAASRPAYEKALEFLRRNPEAGVVPDVVTKTAAEACQLVVQAKLNPGTEFVRTGIPAGREGTVFEQSLPAGTRVPEGTNVILKIYGTVVPSLLGWRVPTAGDIVGEVGLSLDKVTLDRTAPNEQLAERIYWQDPPAGSPIRANRKLVDVRAYAQWKQVPQLRRKGPNSASNQATGR